MDLRVVTDEQRQLLAVDRQLASGRRGDLLFPKLRFEALRFHSSFKTSIFRLTVASLRESKRVRVLALPHTFW